MGFTLGSMLLLLAILWMILPWHVMLALSTCLTGFLLTTTRFIVGRTVQDDDIPVPYLTVGIALLYLGSALHGLCAGGFLPDLLAMFLGFTWLPIAFGGSLLLAWRQQPSYSSSRVLRALSILSPTKVGGLLYGLFTDCSVYCPARLLSGPVSYLSAAMFADTTSKARAIPVSESPQMPGGTQSCPRFCRLAEEH